MSGTISNRSKSGDSARLEHRQVLLYEQLGYGNTPQLLEDIKQAAEGFDHDGLSYIYLRLISCGNKLQISPDDLARYDDNIRKCLDAMNAGRVTVGKTAVVGMKNRDTNKVQAEVARTTDKKTLQGFVVENTTPAAVVYTDEARAHSELPREHQTVGHSAGEYVRKQAHTNGLESFWSILKRGYAPLVSSCLIKNSSPNP